MAGTTMRETIYLDNAATTFPKPEEVYQTMDDVNRHLAVNAGRGSYALGKEATMVIDQTRVQLNKLANGTDVAEVVLTPSATIALNEIVCGQKWKKQDVVYVSPFEHNALMRPLYLMQEKYGFELKELPLQFEQYEIDLDKSEYQFSVTRPTHLFLSHMSNVTGYILPVEKLCEMAKEYGAVTVVDGSQSLGLIPVDLHMLQADYYAFAGHKNLYGPLGAGGFYMKKGLELEVYLAGGTGSDSLNLNMPPEGHARYEAASANIVAIAGLKTAVDVILEQKNKNEYLMHEQYLIENLQKKLEVIFDVKTYRPSSEVHGGILAFNVQGYSSSEIGTMLDDEFHIAVRTGYHCAPLIHKYLKDENQAGVVRASVGRFTTEEDVEKLVEAIKEITEG